MNALATDKLIAVLPVEEYERRQRRLESPVPELWSLLDAVKDPEIPVISLWELGVLQDLSVHDGQVRVSITPTYCGCPAMSTMVEDIVAALGSAGYSDVEVETRLSPAWSTAWMSDEARKKLRDWGVAPPACAPGSSLQSVHCPHCGSDNTRQLSEFGSTACKSLYQCGDCAEPFDYFKPI